MQYLQTLITQTSEPVLSDAISALVAGEIGVGVGLVILILAAVARRLPLPPPVDGTGGVVIAAVLTGLSAAGGLLAAGSDVLGAVGAGVLAAVTSLTSLLVPARQS